MTRDQLQLADGKTNQVCGANQPRSRSPLHPQNRSRELPIDSTPKMNRNRRATATSRAIVAVQEDEIEITPP